MNTSKTEGNCRKGKKSGSEASSSEKERGRRRTVTFLPYPEEKGGGKSYCRDFVAEESPGGRISNPPTKRKRNPVSARLVTGMKFHGERQKG